MLLGWIKTFNGSSCWKEIKPQPPKPEWRLWLISCMCGKLTAWVPTALRFLESNPPGEALSDYGMSSGFDVAGSILCFTLPSRSARYCATEKKINPVQMSANAKKD